MNVNTISGHKMHDNMQGNCNMHGCRKKGRVHIWGQIVCKQHACDLLMQGAVKYARIEVETVCTWRALE